MSSVPTVRVVAPNSPGGYIVINLSDLTNDHELWEDPAEVAAREAEKARAEAEAKAKAEAEAEAEEAARREAEARAAEEAAAAKAQAAENKPAASDRSRKG